MRRILAAPALGALLLGLAAKPATAQTCTGNPCNVNTTATLTVVDLLRLTLDLTSTNLGSPVEANFDAGFILSTGPVATAKANRPWTVSVQSLTANFAYTGSLTDPNKPASDLHWDTSSGGSYTNAMSTSAATLKTGTGTSGTSQGIFYKTLLSYANDVAGSYALGVKFTLSAP
jgi:hypothetical protein